MAVSFPYLGPALKPLALVLCALFSASLAAEAPTRSSGDNPAALPAPRHDTWLDSHRSREARLQKGNVDVLLIGDSITHGWSRQPELVKKFFGSFEVVNLGQSADKTENILWRLRHHSWEMISPRVAIVMAGTNNSNRDEYSADQIAGGVRAIVAELRAKLPWTKIILLGIFPRGSHEQRLELKIGRTGAGMNSQWEKIDRVNRMLPTFADGRHVVFLNINREFLDAKGELPVDYMPDLLHPNEKGYEIWGRSIQPVLATMISPAGTPNSSPQP